MCILKGFAVLLWKPLLSPPKSSATCPTLTAALCACGRGADIKRINKMTFTTVAGTSEERGWV